MIKQSDAELRAAYDQRDINAYANEIEAYYKGSVWERTDILPLRKYLDDVIAATIVLDGVIGSDKSYESLM